MCWRGALPGHFHPLLQAGRGGPQSSLPSCPPPHPYALALGWPQNGSAPSCYLLESPAALDAAGPPLHGSQSLWTGPAAHRPCLSAATLSAPALSPSFVFGKNVL